MSLSIVTIVLILSYYCTRISNKKVKKRLLGHFKFFQCYLTSNFLFIISVKMNIKASKTMDLSL